MIFLKNPITIWLRWYFRYRKLLWRNRNKNIKVGYLSELINVKIGKYNTIYDNVFVTNSKIGDFVYIASNSRISNTTIGNFCSIGSNVEIVFGKHPTNLVSTFPAFYSTRKQCQITFTLNDSFDEIGYVNIGNDVWIGSNCIILDDVTIGDGAIIAAGAVVTHDVPPYTIVGGIPARSIRKRFNDNIIEKLLKFKWWDKDEKWLKENAHLFINTNDFISKL